jgi:succinate dehydrogenase / fumarate reductase flavoprotein subunit
MASIESHDYDVLIIGAGGAGLRAAVEATARGCKTAIITKSLLGKAHTVMAEGGMAAAMGNVWEQDNWKVHFRDTMRGGKMLNNWRMAQIHAQEAPDRVLELESWGALFDRTPDGRILQRDFGGHRYARLAHVGDRTGLEMIRILQQKSVAEDIDVFSECTINQLLVNDSEVNGAVGYWRETGDLIQFRAKSVIMATGGLGRIWSVTSNSWEGTGDGHSLSMNAGAEMIDMEFVQFHPTGMVAPTSVKGILVTEGVRGDGGTLRNSLGERFMFNYIPAMFASETADTEEEADRWYTDKENARRTPDLLPRDEVARAINSEVKAGRGSPSGGVYLDIASRRDTDYIKRRLPSMYHQFMELAGVDITKESMEVGPTAHYVMGGVRVDPESAATSISGLYAAGEVAAGLHGSNRLGGNSLSDLLVFGKRAGEFAAERALQMEHSALDKEQVDEAVSRIAKPFDSVGTENPYTVQSDLRELMQNKVGIIRNRSDLESAIDEIAKLKDREKNVTVSGTHSYNPGWHTALDLQHLLSMSEAITKAALEREESRGGHTRDDFPTPSDEFGKLNIVATLSDSDGVNIKREPLSEMPEELAELFRD